VEPEEGRIVCVLRRYGRKSLSQFWSGWKNRGYAVPEERVFHILENPGRRTGQIVYTEFRSARIGEANTPWGEATITLEEGILRTGERGFLKIVLGDRPVATVKLGLLKYTLTFSGQLTMDFKWKKDGGSAYTGETGTVVIREEEGLCSDSERRPSSPLSKNELKKIPKERRPRSADSNRYTQDTIRVSGILPVDEDDLVFTLAMLISEEMLEYETATGS